MRERVIALRMTTTIAKKAGETVSWTSQAQGTTTEKTGVVLAYLSPRVDAVEVLKRLRPGADIPTHVTTARTSQNPRYMVEVHQKGKRKPRIYMPLASAVER